MDIFSFFLIIIKVVQEEVLSYMMFKACFMKYSVIVVQPQ